MSVISLVEPEAPASVPEVAAAPVIEQPSRLVRMFPIAAVSLAVVASLISAAGLIAASRTIAGASLVVADARERQAQLARIETLIGEVEALRQREQASLERIERFRSAGAATPADVNRALENLRQNMVRHETEGGTLALLRDGQSELAERVGQISLKLERIEQSLNASRKAKPAAGRAPTS
jgi:hypothetical protein